MFKHLIEILCIMLFFFAKIKGFPFKIIDTICHMSEVTCF